MNRKTTKSNDKKVDVLEKKAGKLLSEFESKVGKLVEENEALSQENARIKIEIQNIKITKRMLMQALDDTVRALSMEVMR